MRKARTVLPFAISLIIAGLAISLWAIWDVLLVKPVPVQFGFLFLQRALTPWLALALGLYLVFSGTADIASRRRREWELGGNVSDALAEIFRGIYIVAFYVLGTIKIILSAYDKGDSVVHLTPATFIVALCGFCIGMKRISIAKKRL